MATKKKTPTEKKTCDKCKKSYTINNFYKTNSAFSFDGKTNICKKCIRDMVDEDRINTVYEVLQLMDLPFINELWEKAMQYNGSIFGRYVTMINSLPQYASCTYKDSEHLKSNQSKQDDVRQKTEIKQIDDSNIDLEYLEEKWGYGYTTEEYRLFEKKWVKLIDNYGEKTSLHTEGLITYIRFRVREELATAKGQIKEAKDWGALASAASKDAKLNVAQLSKSDISGGVELLPTLFEAVESEVGIIPILPRILEQPYDDADIIIWSLVNYVRRLEDKPRVAYRDIWEFYDEMIEEHCKQQGFNQQQIDEFKKKRNNVFRDLEAIYKEPVYEGDN